MLSKWQLPQPTDSSWSVQKIYQFPNFTGHQRQSCSGFTNFSVHTALLELFSVRDSSVYYADTQEQLFHKSVKENQKYELLFTVFWTKSIAWNKSAKGTQALFRNTACLLTDSNYQIFTQKKLSVDVALKFSRVCLLMKELDCEKSQRSHDPFQDAS